ncbi:CopG family antitoxin [Alicyclobacillus fodiniaquatilis]|uniref:CopG family antitoxin n=1 Tax=Alicyclobacillus fodiniaquatilis TaxID=1661150 RepID=A0ABW4JCT6_9BACL
MSMKPINNPNEVPQNMTDKESAEYWDTHELTEDFLLNAKPLDESEMPPKRTDAKTITLRMDADTLERLQKVAEMKHKGYQTLLKQFVNERLYEEEKRMHIL